MDFTINNTFTRVGYLVSDDFLVFNTFAIVHHSFKAFDELLTTVVNPYSFALLLYTS